MENKKSNSEAVKKYYKKNPEVKRLENKKNKIRNILRKNNILPPFGSRLNDEQEKIWNDIADGNFTFYDEFKKQKKSLLVGNKKRIHTEEEKKIIKRESLLTHCRKYGILPKLGEPLNKEQQEVYDYILENYDHTPIQSFLSLYSHLATPEHRIWYRAKKTSHKSFYKHKFNIEVEDIIIPELCPYLGVKLLTDSKDYSQPNYYSIDRIDSNKGYVKGNIQIISRLANTMKNGATIDQLLKFSENVIKIHSQNS